MLRSATSEPVLVKPNDFKFMLSWNSDKPPHLPSQSSSEHLYNIYLQLSDANASDRKMAKTEKARKEKKLQFQLKRRNSVLMANVRDELSAWTYGSMRRSWSCIELGKFYGEEIVETKRVSFSFDKPECLETNDDDTSGDTIDEIIYPTKNTYDAPKVPFEPQNNLCPTKIRPILIRRNTTYSGKECVAHMDFDTFVAWRRGSKMSDEVEKQRQKSMKEKEKEANSAKRRKHSGDSFKKEETENGDWWFLRVIKMGFDSCLNRRRVTPSPPTSTEDADVVISVIHASP